MNCPNLVKVTKLTYAKLVKRKEQTIFNLLEVRKMTKLTCLNLVKVSSNLVDFILMQRLNFVTNKAIITLLKISSTINIKVSLDMNKAQKLVYNVVFTYPHQGSV